MSEHRAQVAWRRTTPDFAYDTFSRDHEVVFDGGVKIAASSAPDYKGDAARVDPEKGLVGAVTSCHMLTFLAVSSKKRLVVDSYTCDGVGTLEKGPDGKTWVTKIVLRPKVVFGGTPPTAEEIAKIHHTAHENCFIANSIRSEVTIDLG